MGSLLVASSNLALFVTPKNHLLSSTSKYKLVTSGSSAEEFRLLVASFTAWTEDEKTVIQTHRAAVQDADELFDIKPVGPTTDSQRILLAGGIDLETRN